MSTSADLTQTGILGAIVIVVVATGVKGLWLFRWTHDQIVTSLQRQLDSTVAQLHKELAAKDVESEQWKSLALSQVGIVEQTVDRTAKVVYRSARVLEEHTRAGEPDG